MKKLVALILTFLLVLTGCNTVKVTKVKDDNKTDAIKFHDEYKNIDVNNIYEYSTYSSVLDMIKKGTGIIYLGYNSCKNCKELVPLLNDIAKGNDIKKILYYNIKDIKNNNTEEYKVLETLLLAYFNNKDNNVKKINIPLVIVVKDGSIKGLYNNDIKITKDNVDDVKKILTNLIKEY